MIRKIECFIPVCDVCCKKVDDEAEMVSHFETEAEAKEYALGPGMYGDGDCQEIDGKLCCPRCWCYDDDDEVVLRDTTHAAKDASDTAE